MKSKVEFYDMFFGTLNKKGFSVMEPSSPDYLADIGSRNGFFMMISDFV